MKILRITLDGFKRFNFSLTGKIDLVIDSKLVLLLGPNGSGKSSLLKELSPLPANANDFNKGGYKYIEIEYNNSLYKLTNTFDIGSTKFSFIKDDVELNPGYTVTIYKELVYKFFNLDTTTFNLLNNDSSYIYLNTQERKNWITRISDNDLTYAISFYNKNKELLRDTQGSLKLSRTKLVQETDKLISKDEYEKLSLLIEDSIATIDKLLSIKDNRYIDPIQLKNTIVNLEDKLTYHTSQLNTLITNYPNDSKYSTLDKIDNEVIDTQTSINTLINYINTIESQLKTNIANIDTLKRTKIDSKDNIINKLKELDKEIIDINTILNYSLHFNNPDEALSSYLTIYDNLQDIFINITANPDKLYTKDYYIGKLEIYNRLTNTINGLDNKLKMLSTKKIELDTRKKDSNVECPKCNYNWYLNYNELEYNAVLIQITDITKELDLSKTQHKTLEQELESVKLYLTYFNNYRTLVNTWPILKPVWDNINQDNILYTEPKSLLVRLDKIKEDIVNHIKLKKLTLSKVELNNILDLLNKDSQVSLDNLITIHDKLEKELYDSTSTLTNLKKQLEYIRSLKSILLNIDASRTALEALLSDYTSNMDKVLSIKRKHAIDEIIKTIKLFISDKESLLSKQTIQTSIVENISKSIEEQEELLIYYKAIEKTLSPTEGLIAKSLTGFINTFILQINNFIKKIWSYPLELETIVPDENLDINYKFKVIVNESVVIPDISRLSSAQKEIVDLAIRIVSMKYLNMMDYPLYLDEFAAKMDNAHRKAAFYTINNLLLNSNFSQIFLINHYEDQYGSLKNAQIVDLSNI